jgi:DNA-nicking Smr family endonuclease
MARPPSLDPPRRSRRVRVLSDDERTLWEGVARSVKQLRGRRKARAEAGADTPPVTPANGHAMPAASPSPSALPRAAKAAPPLAPLARRERLHIARGRRDIEARLDLHGLTVIRAHAVLRRFLVRAQGEGLTLVLVITGKGGRDGKGSGALRREVPEWLALAEFRSLVIGFEEAHAAHGGAGALYVRVRRSR